MLAGCVAPPPASPSPEATRATPTPRPPSPVSVVAIGPSATGVSVQVCASRLAGAQTCVRTGADGRGELALVPGTYSIRAGPDIERRLGESVVVADLSVDRSVVIVVEGRGSIGGTVRDTEGRAVTGADVCAHGATGEEVRCARTGADGGYRVEVRPGIHKVEVQPPPTGTRLIPQWARGRVDSFEADLIDTRASDATGLDIVLRRGVVVSGTVSAARDGAPVKEAQVCTLSFAAALPWECERTDTHGRYAALREPERYWVWVIPPGDRGSRLIPQRYDRALVDFDSDPFALFEDRTLDVALTEGTIVRGRVTRSDGVPLVLASVCVDTPFPTGRICRSTGDDGSYEVATRPETYVVNVIAPADSEALSGYWRAAQRDWTTAERVRVGSADLRLDIVLPRGVRLSGTVRDPRGAPVEGATVNVNDVFGPRSFASTDIHGRYELVVLRGSYTVDVFAPRVSGLRSVVGQPIVVDGEVGYDVVLPDAEP